MTSDERRMVAKALRGSFLDPTDELDAALLHAFGYTRDDAEYFDLDYGAMLADLIDPPRKGRGPCAHGDVCSAYMRERDVILRDTCPDCEHYEPRGD